MDAPISQLVDRHALGENMDTWKYLNPESIVSTEADIKSALVSAKERWLQRIKERPESYTQTLVDEYTHLINLLDVSLEKGETNPAKEFFLLSLSDTRKAKDLLIGITHNETNETFGKNTFEMRKKGMIMIERFSANNENPLSRTIIKYGLLDEKGNNLFDVERTFPEWFTAKKVYEHFNGTPIDF
jgi:hypothetical protein